jgi:hypothetical protein
VAKHRFLTSRRSRAVPGFSQVQLYLAVARRRILGTAELDLGQEFEYLQARHLQITPSPPKSADSSIEPVKLSN